MEYNRSPKQMSVKKNATHAASKMAQSKPPSA